MAELLEKDAANKKRYEEINASGRYHISFNNGKALIADLKEKWQMETEAQPIDALKTESNRIDLVIKELLDRKLSVDSLINLLNIPGEKNDE